MKTIKALLQQVDDPQLALLNYRVTPSPWCGLGPAELLFGRRIRTTIPQITSWLIPEWSHLKAFYTDELAKRTQKDNYDKRHGARTQSELNNETEVWVRTGDKQTRGRIVSTSGGIVRRNRQHLIMVPGTQQDRHLEDNSNETLLTEEENSMNDGVNPSNEGNEEPKYVDDEENYQRHIQPEGSSPIAIFNHKPCEGDGSNRVVSQSSTDTLLWMVLLEKEVFEVSLANTSSSKDETFGH